MNKKIERSCNSEEEKQELLKQVKVLKKNLDKGHGVSDIFRKYIVSGSEKFVVFLKDTKHLRVMKPVIEKWFTDAGFSVRMYEVHCKNTDKDKEFQKFTEDKEIGVIKACLSVNMVTEGIHGDIDGVIMLRDTISPNMYFQMIGRAFACGKKTIPLIFDLVANSQFISDAVDNFPNELRGEIEKRKEESEKEGKEYEVGFDVDEFIVMDEFMDVVSGFKAIEGRLKGSWDLYIKALKQYKEREGDCLVPHDYVEVVDGEKVSLGQWCVNIRREHIRIVNKQELDLLGFIWDIDRDSFINNCREISKYYVENNRYPSGSSPMKNVRKLAYFISREKAYLQNEDYPVWKKKIIQKYLPDFSSESISSKSLNTFLYYAKLYREKYGHMDIKTKDIIDGYNIGTKLQNIKKAYDKEKLSSNTIEQIIDLGIFLGRTREDEFDKNMKLVTLAANEKIIINYRNQTYKEKNLYRWIMYTVKTRYQNSKLSLREREYIQKVTGKTLEDLYGNNYRPICVKDIIVNKNIGCFQSAKKAAREMSKINIVVNDTSIYSRLNGKVTTPYKGRFMFYYATDEEVKKYLEDGKLS